MPILLVSCCMAVSRGAWSLVAVSAGLFVVTFLPIIIGNGWTMHDHKLWPNQNNDDDSCTAFFSGRPSLYASKKQSERLCSDTRTAMIGGVFSFISMQLLTIAALSIISLHKLNESQDERDAPDDEGDSSRNESQGSVHRLGNAGRRKKWDRKAFIEGGWKKAALRFIHIPDKDEYDDATLCSVPKK